KHSSFRLGYINQFFQVALEAGITCTWIQNNVFNFVREDGSNMGLALLNAIDTASIQVDKPMNQAKSNVVNQNKATAASPPQSDNIDDISDFVTSANLIQDIEYFIRNFAALGSYFGSTSNIFQATALRVQNLLAEITPNSPDANLPVEYNAWLRDLIATYPGGCTSRATNTFNYYVNKMNAVSAAIHQVVPNCFPLYSSPNVGRLDQLFGITYKQPLIPAAPTLPACDIPGTTGRQSLGPDTQGNPVFQVGTLRIMGSGNTMFYSLGDGASLVGSHYIANDLSTSYAGCQGAYQIALSTIQAQPGLIEATIALNCNGQAGNSIVAPFNIVVNNQQVECVLLNKNDGSNGYFHICGATAAAATTCAGSALQALQGTYPQGYLSTPSYAFYPM
ncbi:hypothetical protein K438DRAFT_1583339, partial [Mycena galopus ATCC 62051]